ncbi:late embryogenesis abundant protein Lea14-A-like [Rhododendron vialii]|uniref:late embryogenesis abundant protein Lea14-A-like n=1 Tax=Rhododendron vialii TaxID=182163 RepID=UPI00265D7435|nr:late embryogenesis abundant protein Lea14-A-like [Rhododendron vialii]
MASLVEKAKNFVTEKVMDIKKPEVDVLDVDLADVSRDGVTYKAKVAIKNPYSHSIPICDLSYSLKFAGRLAGSGKVADPGSLAGNETTVLDVMVKVPHNVLLSLVRDIGADWDIDYELELGLTVDLPLVGNFTIPITKKGQIKLPSLSDLWT